MRHQQELPCCILTYTAGVQHVCPLESFPDDKWDLIIAVNLTAAFHLTKHIVPGMKERGGSVHVCVCVCAYVCVHVWMCTCIFAGWGRIVNTASGHGLVASANKSAYIASKHGIVGLTKVSHDYLSFIYTYKQSGREKSSLNSIYVYEFTTVTVSLCVVRTAC